LIKLTNRIDSWFKKDFKKKFIGFLAFPFLLSFIFFFDYYILPGSLQNERLVDFQTITMSQNVGGTSVRNQRVIGYRYFTENDIQFSTMKKRIKSPEVEISLSPLFKTVKSVMADDKAVKIETGINGINGLLFIVCNSSIFIAVCYTLLAKKISENARLNLIYLHLFIFVLWVIVMIKFGI